MTPVTYITQSLLEAVFMVTYPINFFIKPPLLPEQPYDKEKPTIVIVGTWFNENIFHYQWVHYLQRKGFQVYLVNFPIYKNRFEEHAKNLKAYIEKKQLQDVTLVGISSGGVTCLLFLEQLNGWKRTKHFIALGSPFFGTPLAVGLAWMGAGRELLPTSTFVKKMRHMPLSYSSRVVCLQAQVDQLVPAWSSLLPNTKRYVIPVVGHNSFHLHTKKTYEIIAEEAKK